MEGITHHGRLTPAEIGSDDVGWRGIGRKAERDGRTEGICLGKGHSDVVFVLPKSRLFRSCEADVIAEACVGDKWLELDRDSLQGRPGIPVQVGIIGYGSVKNYHLPAALSTHISVYPF
jgi:hypothetical protein